MSKIYMPQKQLVLPKEIAEVPYSNKIDYATFSRVLREDRVTASYKMYWLLALIDQVSIGNTEIEFKTLICKMVAYAWYPLLKFRLSFGLCDNLAKVVNYISVKYGLDSNYDQNKLFDFLYNCEDNNLNKMLNELTLNVPYRFLSPFFQDKLKGEKKVQKLIEQLSKENLNCIYCIYKNEENQNCIKIRGNWCEYLKYNYQIIKGWAYYKLVCFLQKRNPNVPGIAMKLESPKSRKLTDQRRIWERVIENKHILDLYTGLDFTDENYSKYGVLSIDHFIPWSFVLHDQIWNLIPTFKNINSKKSDNLLEYDCYIDNFCEIQYQAFSFALEYNSRKQIEEYQELLRIENAKKFNEQKNKDEFVKRLKQEIGPSYCIAANQGFAVMKDLLGTTSYKINSI
jgi:hypothetical protein